LGWALITHPFHPLKGQRLAILKIRKIAGQEVLSLYDDKKGSLPIPRDWTDQALLSPHARLIEPTPILDARCLLKLQDLVRVATKSIDDEKKYDSIRPVI
jgi:Family of unknown function (DUF5372)